MPVATGAAASHVHVCMEASVHMERAGDYLGQELRVMLNPVYQLECFVLVTVHLQRLQYVNNTLLAGKESQGSGRKAKVSPIQ